MNGDHLYFDPAEGRPGRRPAAHLGWWSLIGAIFIATLVAALYFWFHTPDEGAPWQPPPQPRPQAPRGEPTAQPEARMPPATIDREPLPALEQSDGILHEAIARLLGGDRAILYPTDIVRRFVASIDNLPRGWAAMQLLPFRPVPGAFLAAPTVNGMVISPENEKRYRPYVVLVESIDAKAAAAMYARFYPLLQESYRMLGHPAGEFHNRLIDAIDDLLAAPELAAPVLLVQPNVLYQFADPELEALSAGQKMMIRMGTSNAQVVKRKLRELRGELAPGLKAAN